MDQCTEFKILNGNEDYKPETFTNDEDTFDKKIGALVKDIKESNEDKNVKQDVDCFIDGNSEIYRKYSLRVVKPALKPFQHMVKMRNRIPQSQLPDEQYICELCSRIFLTPLSYSRHIKRHFITTVYTCSQCYDTFKTNRDLCNHKAENHKNVCFMCQKCELAFSEHYTYLLHTFGHMKKPYKCPECDVNTSDYKSIASHIKIHYNYYTKCQICNKKVSQMGLPEHLKSHKDGIECVECGKTCGNKRSYNYHMTSHTGVKLHQCLYCGKGFASSGQVKVHTVIHTNERRYDCELCHRKFKQMTDLNRHKESHMGIKYECDYCKKKFNSKQSLSYHIHHHVNIRPYKCPNCKLSFTCLSNLRSHMYWAHLSKSKFVCKVCDVSFKVHCQYLRHLKCKSHSQKAFGAETK